MEKGQFLSLIKNFTSLEIDELTELVIAQQNYPYSQTIHNLASRAAADNDAPSKNDLLHLSAIYTTDRAVLKSIMTASRLERIDTKPSFDISSKFSKNDNTVINYQATDVVKNEFLIDTLFADLENLRKSKLFYETNMEALEKETQLIQSIKTHDPEIEIEASVNEDALVEEISTNRHEIPTVDHKQKEQIEIIENFIKTQPGLTKPKTVAEISLQEDLSDKNQHFAENVISETLVEILIKQGKNAKAIEVLKKLIWKFPQKKAYFAAQIEELKK